VKAIEQSKKFADIAKKNLILISTLQAMFNDMGLHIDAYVKDEDGVTLPYRWRARTRRFEIVDRKDNEMVWVPVVDVHDMEKVSDLLKVVDMLYDSGVRELERVSVVLEESYEVASDFYTRISGE
jgi:hypothetical protein|tara:strand:- start:1622 stop:1996 length:375 start_codon:yes stop_codon:yes gene_type:complete